MVVSKRSSWWLLQSQGSRGMLCSLGLNSMETELHCCPIERNMISIRSVSCCFGKKDQRTDCCYGLMDRSWTICDDYVNVCFPLNQTHQTLIYSSILLLWLILALLQLTGSQKVVKILAEFQFRFGSKGFQIGYFKYRVFCHVGIHLSQYLSVILWDFIT